MHVFDDFRGTVKSDVALAPLVWFRLGGPAAYFANPCQIDELVALLKRCRQEGIAFKILGGGSNVLVRDEGVEALVIHLESPFFSDLTVRDNVVEAGAAVPLTALISHSARAGLGGLEVLTGIPGTVGGICVAIPGAVKEPSASSSGEPQCSIRRMRSRSASATT